MEVKYLIALFLLTSTLESNAQKRESTLILVHGAGHGSWSWSKVIPLLANKNISTTAVDLPGQSNDTLKLFNHTLADDVDCIRNATDSVQGKVILAGHSSGGVAIAQAAELLGIAKVEKLIFLDAFMPKDGESVGSIAAKVASDIKNKKEAGAPPEMLFTANHKVFKWNPEIVENHFYHDCSKADIANAKANLKWQSVASISTQVKLSDDIYGGIPKYYILCTEAKDLDKSSIATNVPVKKIFKISSSHSPFLSKPNELARILLEICSDK